MILVSNARGLDKFYNADLLQAKLGRYLRVGPLQHKGRNMRQQDRTAQSLNVPKALRRLHEAEDSRQPTTWKKREHADVQSRTLPQLRLQSSSICYTDGSKQTDELGSHVIGSGVHNADKGLSLSVNAKGLAATNTIIRTELAGRE